MKSKERHSKICFRRWLRQACHDWWSHKILYLIRIIFAIFAAIPIFLLLKDSSSNRLVDDTVENTQKGIILINGSDRPIVANNELELLYLVIARSTAFAMYPDMILVYLVKCRAINTLISKTPFSIFVNHDSHEVHTSSGMFIFYMVGLHSFFHLLRWANASNLYLTFGSSAGVTGFIVLVTLPFIVFLMHSKNLKKILSYELRKGFHYLFFLFAVVMSYHVPTTALPWGGYICYVMRGVLLLYVLDSLVVIFYMTERVASPTFQVLPSGVQMKLTISDAFRKRLVSGGYVYICIPWINKRQWHAFSLYESYTRPNDVFVFMNKVAGGWTDEVHSALDRKTSRPVWLSGPFPSPYHSADLYDNQILVASGIGITPALSILYFLRDHRRVNLIWTVRDPYMLEFILSRMKTGNDAWVLIFYTGKEILNTALEDIAPNVVIYRTRPNLEKTILKLIYGIESGISLPETIELSTKEKFAKLLHKKMKEPHMIDLDDFQKFRILSDFAHENGYGLADILNDGGKRRNSKNFRDMRSRSIRSNVTTESDNDRDLIPTLESLHLVQNMLDSITSNMMEKHKQFERKGSMKALLSNELYIENDLNDGKTLGGKEVDRFDTATDITFFEKHAQNHENALSFVNNLKLTKKGKSILDSWGILYCGGNSFIKDDLQNVSQKFDIDLRIESFKW